MQANNDSPAFLGLLLHLLLILLLLWVKTTFPLINTIITTLNMLELTLIKIIIPDSPRTVPGICGAFLRGNTRHLPVPARPHSHQVSV